jgi:DNA-binding IscR family transcriptional regulator
VQLARPAREIRLRDVLSAVEPVGEFERCFLWLQQCDDQHPCPIHDDWAPIRTSILEKLENKSLWEFANAAERSGTLSWQHGKEKAESSADLTAQTNVRRD